VSLADDLDQLANSQHCATCEWCQSRTADEQARITAQIQAFRDEPQRYGRYTALLNVFTRHGLQTTPDAFRHHCRAHVA